MDAGARLIRLAVFGKPVAHSLSPRIHGLFAAQFALEVDYRAIEATQASFPHQVDELERGGGRGCNVTVPLKQAAWQLGTRCSDSANRAQAANTLLFEDGGGRYADNTDGPGLVKDLATGPLADPAGARICLLGAGGAAAGILAALLRAEPRSLLIVNRTVAKARQLAARHADLGPVSACGTGDVAGYGPFDLVINATSIGHRGEAPALTTGWLAPGGGCYDLNYGPAAEPLRQACAAQGIPYSDGLGMLVRQAALSFELWTGLAPDTDAVLAELRG